jgi:hypothetical protein
MPRLVAPWFDGLSTHPHWPRLARVLAYSARQHCPTWSIEVTPIGAPVRRLPVSEAFQANTVKLDEWTRVVLAAADGEELAILDADTLVTGPLESVWTIPFDVAITRRPPQAMYPYNAGVVFVRVSPVSRAFFRAWCDENRLMLADRGRHLPWKRQYGGINQAALGAILHQPHAAAVRDLPCPIWNCEDESWPLFTSDTRIVHIKSALRRALFHQAPLSPTLAPLAQRWRQAETAAGYVAPQHSSGRLRIPLPRHRRVTA